MIEWCVSDCGNMECRHNRQNRSLKEKEMSADVYMKGNTARGCEGWKRPKKKPAKKAGRRKR